MSVGVSIQQSLNAESGSSDVGIEYLDAGPDSFIHSIVVAVVHAIGR